MRTCEENGNDIVRKKNSIEKMFPKIQKALSTFKSRPCCKDQQKHLNIENNNSTIAELEAEADTIRKERLHLNTSLSTSYSTLREQNTLFDEKLIENSDITSCTGCSRMNFDFQNIQAQKKEKMFENGNEKTICDGKNHSRWLVLKNQFQNKAKVTGLKNNLMHLKEELDSFIELNKKESDKIYQNAKNQFRDIITDKGLLKTKYRKSRDYNSKEIILNQEMKTNSPSATKTTKSFKKVLIEGLGKRIRERTRSS